MMLRATSCHHLCSLQSLAWASVGLSHPIHGTWQLPEPPGKLLSRCPGSVVTLEKLRARSLRAGRAPAAPGSAPAQGAGALAAWFEQENPYMVGKVFKRHNHFDLR